MLDKTLAFVRLDRAKECLNDAKSLLDETRLRSSANRSYYAIFHAMRAALAIKGIDSKKHSGIIAMFRKEYCKTSIFSVEMSEIITKAFYIRTNSDYDDFYVVTKEEVIEQVKNAELFISEIQKFLEQL